MLRNKSQIKWLLNDSFSRHNLLRWFATTLKYKSWRHIKRYECRHCFLGTFVLEQSKFVSILDELEMSNMWWRNDEARSRGPFDSQAIPRTTVLTPCSQRTYLSNDGNDPWRREARGLLSPFLSSLLRPCINCIITISRNSPSVPSLFLPSLVIYAQSR